MTYYIYYIGILEISAPGMLAICFPACLIYQQHYKLTFLNCINVLCISVHTTHSLLFPFYLFCSNGVSVEGATHKQVVDLIKSGGDCLTLTVISVTQQVS